MCDFSYDISIIFERKGARMKIMPIIFLRKTKRRNDARLPTHVYILNVDYLKKTCFSDLNIYILAE